MSSLSIPTQNAFQPELAISQFVIPAGAGGLFSVSGNIATITFNAAHGLTMSPAAGVPPNFFITFGGSTSGVTGTGILVGNIFRILDIPSATTIKIYTTITAATVTSLTGIPVFYPPFTASAQSGFAGGPLMTGAVVAGPNYAGANFNVVTGANCAVRYNPANDAVILDGSTGNTPATAPTWRDIIAVSSRGQVYGAPPGCAIWASGTTATTQVSVIQ